MHVPASAALICRALLDLTSPHRMCSTLFDCSAITRSDSVAVVRPLTITAFHSCPHLVPPVHTGHTVVSWLLVGCVQALTHSLTRMHYCCTTQLNTSIDDLPILPLSIGRVKLLTDSGGSEVVDDDDCSPPPLPPLLLLLRPQ